MTDKNTENQTSPGSLGANVSINDERDEITIYGIRYSGAMFRGLGFAIRDDEFFQIIKRDDGIISIRTTRETPHYLELARKVANGNFNKKEVIEMAKMLCI